MRPRSPAHPSTGRRLAYQLANPFTTSTVAQWEMRPLHWKWTLGTCSSLRTVQDPHDVQMTKSTPTSKLPKTSSRPATLKISFKQMLCAVSTLKPWPSPHRGRHHLHSHDIASNMRLKRGARKQHRLLPICAAVLSGDHPVSTLARLRVALGPSGWALGR